MGTIKAAKKRDKRGLKVYMEHLPDDVRKTVIEAQGLKQNECKCDFSPMSTIYMLIRMVKENNLI